MCVDAIDENIFFTYPRQERHYEWTKYESIIIGI